MNSGKDLLWTALKCWKEVAGIIDNTISPITVFILTDEQRLFMLSYSFQIISVFMHHHDCVLAYGRITVTGLSCFSESFTGLLPDIITAAKIWVTATSHALHVHDST